MSLDMLVGIFIVAAVTVVFVTTLRHERLAETALADSRSAVHLAEHALLNLQHGQPLPDTPDGMSLSIHPAPTGVAPAGFIWAQVDATVHGHHQSLLGVVPVAALLPSGAKL